MGSHMNFKNMAADGSNGRPSMGNYPLARQSSVYSLTFDEFQNTLGGLGKDFGSMNMDEFLKNIWTAEETQVMASAFAVAEGGPASSNLQRQGSLTLPRTLSQKTVDEVWRDMFRENGGRDGNNGNLGSNLPQRQPTLGEITLEEFLVRAGVVREETQLGGRPDNSGFYAELARSSNNADLGLGFLDTGRSNGIATNRILENNNNQIPNLSPNLAINVNGVRSSQQTQQQQQQQLFPKQANMGYASSMQLASNGENGNGNVGLRSSVMGIGDPTVSNGFTHGGGGMGMIGLGTGGVTVAVESPSQLSSDGLGKSNGDTSSLSPVPYVFNGIRGKKCGGPVEKVVERRQRRMIKNRESAARSRARKQHKADIISSQKGQVHQRSAELTHDMEGQDMADTDMAYTMELEAEVAKLKEENKELQKKQAEFLEMQKNQTKDVLGCVLKKFVPQNSARKLEQEIQQDEHRNQTMETNSSQEGAKRRCLRRTQTGPW